MIVNDAKRELKRHVGDLTVGSLLKVDIIIVTSSTLGENYKRKLSRKKVGEKLVMTNTL